MHRLALLPDSVLGEQLHGDDRTLSPRKRVATSSAFRTKPRDALCLSFNAHDESNDVMQGQFPGPQKPSGPAYITRQPADRHHHHDLAKQREGPMRAL